MSFLKDTKTPKELALQEDITDKKNRESELQKLLDNTDHKIFPDYDKKEGEDLDAIKAKRTEWRSEIRDIQTWLKDNDPNLC